MPRRAISLAALLLLAGCAEAPGPQTYKPDCHHQADQADGLNLAVSCMVVNNYIIGGTATASPPVSVTLPTTVPGLPLPAVPNAAAAFNAAPALRTPTIAGAAITTANTPAPAAPDIWARTTFRFAHDPAGNLITESLR
jgi:hypothetical protein